MRSLVRYAKVSVDALQRHQAERDPSSAANANKQPGAGERRPGFLLPGVRYRISLPAARLVPSPLRHAGALTEMAAFLMGPLTRCRCMVV